MWEKGGGGGGGGIGVAGHIPSEPPRTNHIGSASDSPLF